MRGNLAGDPFVIVSGWARGEVRYALKIRWRNTSQHEEQLHCLRIQLRRNGELLSEDWYSIQFEVALPPNKWVTREVDHGFHFGARASFDQADSIWFAADIVGSQEKIERKVVDLDHATPLQIA